SKQEKYTKQNLLIYFELLVAVLAAAEDDIRGCSSENTAIR
ncbi:MAG: hypothetical protein UY78_C0040G0007, partial [Parcubacteria group bacterium GW2011_GWA1_53_13]